MNAGDAHNQIRRGSVKELGNRFLQKSEPGPPRVETIEGMNAADAQHLARRGSVRSIANYYVFIMLPLYLISATAVNPGEGHWLPLHGGVAH